MLTLIYRSDLKGVDVHRLQRQDWDSDGRVLTLPERVQMGRTKEGRRRLSADVDGIGKQRLEEWLLIRKSLGALPSSPLFCGASKQSVRRPVDLTTLRRTLRSRGLELGIERRLTPENLRYSGRAHRAVTARHLQLVFAPYLDEEDFGFRYPTAHALWSNAADLLSRDPELHATRIGHDCREALVAFAAELIAQQGVRCEAIPRAHTVARVRAVLDAQVSSEAVRAQLEALLSYWGTVSDLPQRQEHGGHREGEPLSGADSRRVVFQTRVVMYEIDHACARHVVTGFD